MYLLKMWDGGRVCARSGVLTLAKANTKNDTQELLTEPIEPEVGRKCCWGAQPNPTNSGRISDNVVSKAQRCGRVIGKMRGDEGLKPHLGSRK